MHPVPSLLSLEVELNCGGLIPYMCVLVLDPFHCLVSRSLKYLLTFFSEHLFVLWNLSIYLGQRGGEGSRTPGVPSPNCEEAARAFKINFPDTEVFISDANSLLVPLGHRFHFR